MADKDKENKAAGNDDSSKSADVKVGILTWVIMATVVVALSSSGFVLGRLVACSPSSDTAEVSQENVSPASVPQDPPSTPANKSTWYYNELESIVVNPKEPGATRYVRVGLILEMDKELSQEKARTMIENKKPLLINWLNLYFKGLSLSQMEDERDMNRILSQVCDGFNEILFSETEPQIRKILIREFNIQ